MCFGVKAGKWDFGPRGVRESGRKSGMVGRKR